MRLGDEQCRNSNIAVGGMHIEVSISRGLVGSGSSSRGGRK